MDAYFEVGAGSAVISLELTGTGRIQLTLADKDDEELALSGTMTSDVAVLLAYVMENMASSNKD